MRILMRELLQRFIHCYKVFNQKEFFLTKMI